MVCGVIFGMLWLEAWANSYLSEAEISYAMAFLFCLFRKKPKKKVVTETHKNHSLILPLSELKPNEQAVIQEISAEITSTLRNRLLDLGFVKGSRISVYLTSPMNDPRAYLIRNTTIALRNHQARYILVKPYENETDNL